MIAAALLLLAAASEPADPVDPNCPPEHAAMGHCTPKAVAPAADAVGTDLPAGTAPPPPAPPATAADAVWGAGAMQPSRRALWSEHGGSRMAQLMIDRAEVGFHDGAESARWSAEFWAGGDRDRLVLKSEGEAAFGKPADNADVEALYSRALDPYWNLQAGIRQDLGTGPRRTWASLGVEGLAPYWFELEAGLLLSTKGEAVARLEASYDQRITQSLILQPAAGLKFAFQTAPDIGLGNGFSSAELGLRLRHEIAREFAPYAGLSWERKLGRTADLARAHGDGTGGLSVVLGVRAWF